MLEEMMMQYSKSLVVPQTCQSHSHQQELDHLYLPIDNPPSEVLRDFCLYILALLILTPILQQ